MRKQFNFKFKPSSAVRAGVLVVLTGVGSAAMATEYGRVVSSTPVSAQVPVPQQVCRDEQQYVQAPSSGGGALLGAVVGGVIGNAFGAGGGRALSTGLGVVSGAAIGDRAEAANRPGGTAIVRNCQTATRYDNQIVGYDVVYEYNGQRYTTRTVQEPGRQIALDVSVAPAVGWQPVPPNPAYSQPVYQAPQAVYDDSQVVYAQPAPGYVYGAPAAVVVPRVVIGVGGGGYWRHGGYWR